MKLIIRETTLTHIDRKSRANALLIMKIIFNISPYFVLTFLSCEIVVMKRFVSVTACLIHNNYQSESMVGKCCRHLPYIKPAAKFTANPIQGRWWKDLLKWLKIITSSRRTPASTRHRTNAAMSRVCRDGIVSSGNSFEGGHQQRQDINHVLV